MLATAAVLAHLLRDPVRLAQADRHAVETAMNDLSERRGLPREWELRDDGPTGRRAVVWCWPDGDCFAPEVGYFAGPLPLIFLLDDMADLHREGTLRPVSHDDAGDAEAG